MEQGIIERAFGLASSGSCSDIRQLEKALCREGFTRVGEHLSGRSLRTQLKALMDREAPPGRLRHRLERSGGGKTP